MSEYQRFISYMYEYRGNTRFANCGYARIDNRNHVLKLEIHMKIALQAAEDLIHIYGCFQKAGQLYGIAFGQHMPALGMVNWRMQCDADHILDTEIPFSAIEGLILQTEGPLSYCSIWNDQSIRPTNMLPYPDSLKDSSTVETTDDESLTLPTALTKDTAAAPHITPQSGAAPTLLEKLLAQTPPASDDSTASEPIVSSVLSAEAAYIPSVPFSRWEYLTQHFPPANIFTEGVLKDCVRVEPTDFSTLRKEGFPIASNRFILHCFHRDPHCLLGRIHDTEQYIFAIPGIYDKQERFMANTYGFPCFKPLNRDATPSPGQKGYWYRALH